MTEFNKGNTDDWKEKLRSAFISAFSGNPQENIQVYTEVGYYYICIVHQAHCINTTVIDKKSLKL